MVYPSSFKRIIRTFFIERTTSKMYNWPRKLRISSLSLQQSNITSEKISTEYCYMAFEKKYIRDIFFRHTDFRKLNFFLPNDTLVTYIKQSTKSIVQY